MKEQILFIHPLARDDQHLIQDFMLTKIALLFARDAEDSEWTFELQLMDKNSSGAQGSTHAFLFVYTVARYCLAAAHAQPAGSDQRPADEDSQFLEGFLEAVDNNASSRALSLWEASSANAETLISAAPIQALVFGLLHAFLPSSPGTTTRVADFLPDPYTDHHSVGWRGFQYRNEHHDRTSP